MGVCQGKHYYETTVTDEGLCRVGWATARATLELGKKRVWQMGVVTCDGCGFLQARTSGGMALGVQGRSRMQVSLMTMERLVAIEL